MKEAYIKIEGRVQSVGYRRWAMLKALEIGNVFGWVRNEFDGSVEILMNGDNDSVNMMIQACYDGPLFARVDRILFLSKAKDSFLPSIIDGKFIII
jgi:acylphosphatase